MNVSACVHACMHVRTAVSVSVRANVQNACKDFECKTRNEASMESMCDVHMHVKCARVMCAVECRVMHEACVSAVLCVVQAESPLLSCSYTVRGATDLPLSEEMINPHNELHFQARMLVSCTEFWLMIPLHDQNQQETHSQVRRPTC